MSAETTRSPTCQAKPAVLPLATPTLDFSVAHVFNVLYPALSQSLPRCSPVVVRGISAAVWACFRDEYAEHPLFKGVKFEYDDIREKIITVPFSKPLHDIANKVMSVHIYLGILLQTLRQRTLNQREPDSAVWTRHYESGIVPTIVWEVGHSQKRSSLYRRAKMWCRRYDGKVHVVILVKYLRKDPSLDNASILEVYRPAYRSRTIGGPPRWTARKDGRTYQLFPRPPEAIEGAYETLEDTIPLTYRDYFGEGNVGAGVDPSTRFDLPLESQYRYASGGSSVGGVLAVEDALLGDEAHLDGGERAEDGAGVDLREQSPEEHVGPDGDAEMEEYAADDDDWDAAMSDVSDASESDI
ncbi:hypothetical protein Q9L58_006835 [Maublancomyces gigas]|uniref:Uncharacterized protein n=1 Tax=Discina gigas TaxID=1032678 RepID=A0ABR3GE67_9PEZI